jgi:hypothetical protein
MEANPDGTKDTYMEKGAEGCLATMVYLPDEEGAHGLGICTLEDSSCTNRNASKFSGASCLEAHNTPHLISRSLSCRQLGEMQKR